MKIDGVLVNEIPDSRGDKTIEVLIEHGQDRSVARVPSGKSRGKKEAAVISPKDAMSVLESGLRDELVGKNFGSTRELDEFLISFDGTENKAKIGGNLSLGISISFTRGVALEKGKELWEVLREEFFDKKSEEKVPAIFSNMINGGAHAKTNLDIQEYQVVCGMESASDMVKVLKDFYERLGDYLRKEFNSVEIRLGDEKGYAMDFRDNFEPIGILNKLIHDLGMGNSLSVGLDVAATNFQSGEKYIFDGANMDRKKLLAVYGKYFKDADLLSFVEDPFGEEDFEGFREFREICERGVIVIGDDLTVTSPELISEYGDELISGVIIKPNQIGTVTETCEALNTGASKGLFRIVSHRSGEVDDQFLIHFAKASGAEGVKIGAPFAERMEKFNELERLYS